MDERDLNQEERLEVVGQRYAMLKMRIDKLQGGDPKLFTLIFEQFVEFCELCYTGANLGGGHDPLFLLQAMIGLRKHPGPVYTKPGYSVTHTQGLISYMERMFPAHGGLIGKTMLPLTSDTISFLPGPPLSNVVELVRSAFGRNKPPLRLLRLVTLEESETLLHGSSSNLIDSTWSQLHVQLGNRYYGRLMREYRSKKDYDRRSNLYANLFTLEIKICLGIASGTIEVQSLESEVALWEGCNQPLLLLGDVLFLQSTESHTIKLAT